MPKKEKNYTFMVIIEKAKRNYSCYSPDLPGCISVGDSIEETREIMRGALRTHVKGMIEDGDPIPEPWVQSDDALIEFIEIKI